MIDIDLECEKFQLQMEIHDADQRGEPEPELTNRWYVLVLQGYTPYELMAATCKHVDALASAIQNRRTFAREFNMARLQQISNEIKRRTEIT